MSYLHKTPKHINWWELSHNFFENRITLLVTDNFSTFSYTMLIPLEKADFLKTTIILLTSNIRHPGFTLLSKGDNQLKNLDIILSTRDKFNKNYNAVVDHTCQELEGEIMKQAPEGSPITQSKLAIITLSQCKIMKKGNIIRIQNTLCQRSSHRR